MEGIAAEVGQKLKSAIKAKLMELGVYVDEELPNYVMVMVTNRRSKSEMDKELQLFLGDHTNEFTSWLQSVWTKLEQVTVSTSDYSSKRKVHEDKKKKKKKRNERESTEERKIKKDKKSPLLNDISDLPVKVEKEEKSSSNDEKSVVVEPKKHKNETRSDINKEVKSIENEELKAKTKVETESTTESVMKTEPSSPKKTGVVGELSGEEEDFLNIRDDTEADLFSGNEETVENHVTKDIDEQVNQKKHEVNEDISKPDAEMKVDESSRKVIKKDIEENKRRVIDERHVVKVSVEEERDRKLREVETRREPGRRRINRISAYERLGARSSTDRVRKNKIRSRSRSRSRSIHKSRSRSLSPARRLRSSNRDPKLLEDARELINRKRGKYTADDGSESSRRVLVKSDAERRVLNLENTKDRESRYRRVATDRFSDKESSSRHEDNRSSRVVLDGRNRDEDRKEVSDKRPLKRRNSEKDSDEEELANNVKDSKSKLDGISSVAVAVKIPPRPKVPAEKSATRNLIRRAVAEAHKSLLSNVRPDHVKKSDSVSSRTGGKHAYRVSNQKKLKETIDNEQNEINDRMPEIVEEYKEDTNNVYDSPQEIVTIDDKVLPEDDLNWTNKMDDNEVEEVEEVTMEALTDDDVIMEDSEKMITETSTQFVVTLTGIDPSLYPVTSTTDIVDEEMTEVVTTFTPPPVSKLNGVKSKDKCKFWPNCLTGDSCVYHHPTTVCKMFPNCKFGSACLYIHPNCKFDASCTRYDCPYVHTSARPASSFYNGTRTQVSSSTQQCRYYPNCTNVACPFQHSFQKVCRYDRNCTNNYCPYTHSSYGRGGIVIAPIEKLRWSRPITPPQDTNGEKDTNSTMEAETTVEIETTDLTIDCSD